MAYLPRTNFQRTPYANYRLWPHQVLSFQLSYSDYAAQNVNHGEPYPTEPLAPVGYGTPPPKDLTGAGEEDSKQIVLDNPESEESEHESEEQLDVDIDIPMPNPTIPPTHWNATVISPSEMQAHERKEGELYDAIGDCIHHRKPTPKDPNSLISEPSEHETFQRIYYYLTQQTKRWGGRTDPLYRPENSGFSAKFDMHFLGN